MPAPDPHAAARCEAVSVQYRSASGVVDALRAVDATFCRGRLTVLAGPSGSGKSSLLRTLAGLQLPSSGAVVVDGVDLARLRAGARRRLRRRSIGVVVQEPANNLLEYLRAREQVALAARLRRAGAAEVDGLLETLGLADHAAALPDELSGGQQQRVAFATAAVGRPSLLLADEPTASLDGESSAVVISAMQSLAATGRTLVVASHDPAVIAAADQVVTLHDGRRAPSP